MHRRSTSRARIPIFACALLLGCTQLRQFGLTPPSPAPPSTGPAASPSAAPPSGIAVGGDRLLVIDDAGNLLTMDPDGQQVLPLETSQDPGITAGQPVWAPDGRSVAWVEADRRDPLPQGQLIVAGRDGTERRQLGLPFVPFFLQWDPTSTRIAYLGNAGPTIGMGVATVGAAGLTDAAVGTGRPFYLSWAPDGAHLLVHVGTEGLGITDLTGHVDRLAQRPGVFQAPVWLPDGDLLYVARTGARQTLVLDHDGHERPLLGFAGGVLFAASPDGRRIAYRLDRPDGTPVGVFVTSVDGGAPVLVTRDVATAFFWSPRGDRLLVLTKEPGSGVEALSRWHVWQGTERFVGDPFLPSPTFLQAYAPFFDQYARSLSPWAPDGSAFAYAGLHDGTAGIWVQSLSGARERRFVVDGGIVSWAPTPTDRGTG